MLMGLLFLLLSGFLAFSKVYFFIVSLCMYIHMTKSPVLISPLRSLRVWSRVHVCSVFVFFGIG